MLTEEAWETAANWYWYSGSCGGASEGNGSTIITAPTVTTDYYVRAEVHAIQHYVNMQVITLNTNTVQE